MGLYLTFCLQPDFGDMAEEMKVLRLQREKEEEEHRAKLRAAYQAKKAKEEEVRQAELAVCILLRCFHFLPNFV